MVSVSEPSSEETRLTSPCYHKLPSNSQTACWPSMLSSMLSDHSLNVCWVPFVIDLASVVKRLVNCWRCIEHSRKNSELCRLQPSAKADVDWTSCLPSKRLRCSSADHLDPQLCIRCQGCICQGQRGLNFDPGTKWLNPWWVMKPKIASKGSIIFDGCVIRNNIFCDCDSLFSESEKSARIEWPLIVCLKYDKLLLGRSDTDLVRRPFNMSSHSVMRNPPNLTLTTAKHYNLSPTIPLRLDPATVVVRRRRRR